MKRIAIVLLIAALGGCSTEKKETPDYAELLKIKDALEKGTGNTLNRYTEIIGPEKLEGIESNPEFIRLRDDALADVNDLIVLSLEEGVDKDEILECIKKNGADSEACRQYVEPLQTNASPRLKQYNTELGKFIANHLDKKSHLPKGEGSCKAVRTGTFWQIINGDTIRITRDDTFEIEEMDKVIRKEQVTWINECTYRIQLIPQGTEQANLRDFPDDCIIEIIRVTSDHYIYKIYESANGVAGDLADIGKVYFSL